jgi:hypothetical protein
MIIKIIELLFIIGIGVIVMLFVSAPVGVTILLMVGVGMFFSIAVTISTALLKSVKVTVAASGTSLFKGESIRLKITVKNRTIIPAGDVRVKILLPGEGLAPLTAKDTVRFSVAGRSEETFEMEYRAEIWGQYKIGAVSVRLGDFLGIFSLPWSVSGKGTFEVCVFPNIIEIDSEDGIIGNALEALFDDESEETTESANTFGGFPGYNHRDYVPGDPIKRINWKMSAKRGSLLLRLDDEIETSEIDIVLTGGTRAVDVTAAVNKSIGSKPGGANTGGGEGSVYGGSGYRLAEEEAVETVLGLADLFTKLDIKVNVRFYFVVHTIAECTNAEDVKSLQSLFAWFSFTEDTVDSDGLPYYIKVSPGELPELVKTG